MSKSYSWWCGRKKRIKKKYTLLCGSYISPKELKDFYRRHKPMTRRMKRGVINEITHQKSDAE